MENMGAAAAVVVSNAGETDELCRRILGVGPDELAVLDEEPGLCAACGVPGCDLDCDGEYGGGDAGDFIGDVGRDPLGNLNAND